MSDRIYINCAQTIKRDTDQIVHFKKEYTQPLIENTDQWTVSIDRFMLPLDSIPLFFYDNVTPHAYTCVMGWVNSSGVEIRTPLVDFSYIGWSNWSTDSPKYYVYFFDQMIRMMNQSISTALTQLRSLTTIPAGAKPSYYQINYDTNQLEYVAQKAYYDEELTTNQLRVYFNHNVANKFLVGMPEYYTVGSTIYLANRFTCYDVKNNTQTIGSEEYYVMHSANGSHTLISWNDVRGIAFVAMGMNISNEIMPNLNDNDGSISAFPILSNFDLVYSVSDIFPLRAQFLSLTDNQKKITMLGGTLTRIDIKPYYYLNNFQLVEFTSNIDNTFSIRLKFEKKL